MKRLFVDFLFNYLESNFNYLILRNYENLPEDEGHDIDLLINIAELHKIEKIIQILEEKFPILIFKNYRYDNLKSHIIVFDDEILHLDFFTQVQWNRIDLFETKNLLEQKIRFKNKYWILNPNNFQQYCWFLYIIRKGELKKSKYINNAFLWHSNQNEKININNNLSVNKIKLLYSFLRKNPLKVILGTIKNIFFKASKILRPYGKIFHPDSNPITMEFCLDYCFIGKLEYIKPEVNHLAIIKIYKALSDERGIIVSKGFLESNPIIRILLRKFIIKTTVNLKESIGITLK